MEVIYKVNNKTFTDKKEAEKYEKILAEDAEKREKLNAEKEARWKEVNDAWNNYYNLLKNFEKDYNYLKVYPSIFDFFE
jgi:hypothetical protein